MRSAVLQAVDGKRSISLLRDRYLQFRDRHLRFRDRHLWSRDRHLWLRDRHLWFRDRHLRFRDRHLWSRDRHLWFRDRHLWFRDRHLWFRDRHLWFRDRDLAPGDRDPSPQLMPHSRWRNYQPFNGLPPWELKRRRTEQEPQNRMESSLLPRDVKNASRRRLDRSSTNQNNLATEREQESGTGK